MVSMTFNQYRGNVGEIEATRLLLDFGMSINSLTGSDFGWDLHAQLPVSSTFSELAPDADAPPWELSGRAAHFQVKSLAHGSTLSLRTDTLQQWVAASRGGLPTFLLIEQRGEDENAGQWWTVSPSGLASALAGARRSARTRKIRFTHPAVGQQFHRYAFWARIDLWSTNPALMAAAEDRIPLPDDYIRGRELDARLVEKFPEGIVPEMELDYRVITLLIDLAHSYLALFHPQKALDSRKIRDVADQLIAIYSADPRGPWSAENVLPIVEDSILHRGTRVGWEASLLPPGAFTSAVDARHAWVDVCALVSKLAAYSPSRNQPF
ncbi:hypothetical protein [Curtobacterium sp. BRD11]|uniref:hypothetical protein n=1 Tax=Curtobacterium sp. BRD11 TaxID=2962581 RepID=UPI002882D1CB|nr:hypothetical protein [Curtobacterium sp. BRD11]MDT0212064.1 hypothetical protein [Curtobacterium sp. BRD11]